MTNATQLLERFHLGGTHAYLHRKEPYRESRWFRVGEPIPKLRDDHGIWFGLHPCFEIPPKNSKGETKGPKWVRSQLDYIGVVNLVYAEFDAKDFEPEMVRAALIEYGEKEFKNLPKNVQALIVDAGKPRALTHIGALDPEPSAVTDSGGGYHAYWLLTEPFYLNTDEDRRRAKRLQAAWVTYTGGDDGAKDLARILRLPGTLNHKYDPPRLVRFERCDLDNEYSLVNLESTVGDLLEPAQEPRQAASSTDRTYTHAEDVAQAKKNLERLATWRRDDYNSDEGWIGVGMALSELGSDGLTLWDEWSQPSTKYVPGLCAEKWATFKPGSGPGDLRLASLKHWADEDDPLPDGTVNDAGQRDHEQARSTSQQTEPPTPAAGPVEGDVQGSEKPTERKRRITSPEYLQALAGLGYTFQMRETTDTIEVGEQPISDPLAAEIRTKMRDQGYMSIPAMEDAYVALSYKNSYHPVKRYLEGLAWDGGDHIGELCAKLKGDDGKDQAATDTRAAIPVFFKRWLIGAVAKAYDAEQNRMLVIDAEQNKGKSHLARWLGSPLEELFIEGPINPENKDDLIRLASCWIWEVAELGGTTRKADREALKHFLTRRSVTVRKPYGHHDMRKPALASFVGTVNNESGFLSDPTGNRRFMVCHIREIDWSYTDLDVNQLWAQAYALYQQGETWQLKGKELELAQRINAGYEIDDPLVAHILDKYVVTGDNHDFVSTLDLLNLLHMNGWRLRTPRSESMALGSVFKHKRFGGVEKYSTGTQRGYTGLRLAAEMDKKAIEDAKSEAMRDSF